jgi:hypothetical protein
MDKIKYGTGCFQEGEGWNCCIEKQCKQDIEE